MSKRSHGNAKECAPFSIMCLEIVTMQKYNDAKNWTQKDANVKRYKLLNETYSLLNIVLSELIIIYIHCTCVCIIKITGLIIDISQCVLIVEYGGYTI